MLEFVLRGELLVLANPQAGSSKHVAIQWELLISAIIHVDDPELPQLRKFVGELKS